MIIRAPLRRKSLRGYRPGRSPFPVYSFRGLGGCAGCSGGSGCGGCRKRLGDDAGIDPATGLSYQYEAAFGTSNPSAGGNAPIGINPATGLSYQYEAAFGTSNPGRGGNPPLALTPQFSLPSPSILLPGSTTTSILGGLSSTTLLYGGLGVVALVLLMKRR